MTVRIIIAGEKRSGTNPLRLALGMDPNISAPHPPHILQRLNSLLDCYGSLEIDQNWFCLVEDVIRLIKTDPVPWEYQVPGSSEHRAFEIEYDAINSKCMERSLPAIYIAVMDYFAEIEGSTAWLSKSGQDIQFANELDSYCERHFKCSIKWIWLHRDPRDVALSSRKAPIGPKHPYVCAKRWNWLNSLCKEYASNHPDRMVKTGYEDFVKNPSETLKKICAFLNIEFIPSMLEFHKSRDAQRAAETSPLWGNLNKPVTTASVRKFEREMSRPDLAIIENVAGPIMEQFGYERIVHTGDIISYSDELIQQFEHEDRILQTAAQKGLPEHELRARSRQWLILDEISSRKGL